MNNGLTNKYLEESFQEAEYSVLASDLPLFQLWFEQIDVAQCLPVHYPQTQLLSHHVFYNHDTDIDLKHFPPSKGLQHSEENDNSFNGVWYVMERTSAEACGVAPFLRHAVLHPLIHIVGEELQIEKAMGTVFIIGIQT